MARSLVEKDDHIMVAIGNKIEFAIAVMAIWICGKTAILLDRNLTKRELNAISHQSNSTTLLTDEINREWEHEYDVIVVKILDPGIKVEEVMSYKVGSSIAILIPTSGTVGNAKIVPLSHDNIKYLRI